MDERDKELVSSFDYITKEFIRILEDQDKKKEEQMNELIKQNKFLKRLNISLLSFIIVVIIIWWIGYWYRGGSEPIQYIKQNNGDAIQNNYKIEGEFDVKRIEK